VVDLKKARVILFVQCGTLRSRISGHFFQSSSPQPRRSLANPDVVLDSFDDLLQRLGLVVSAPTIH
jgi:hypothetical protein